MTTSNIIKEEDVVKHPWDYIDPSYVFQNESIKDILLQTTLLTSKIGRGNTCLHLLAEAGNVDVLAHLMVSLIGNYDGDTPLHLLAKAGKDEILSHPDCVIVKNEYGKTPKDLLDQFKGRG